MSTPRPDGTRHIGWKGTLFWAAVMLLPWSAYAFGKPPFLAVATVALVWEVGIFQGILRYEARRWPWHPLETEEHV